MQNLKVTAHLSAPIAVFDNYSPALDSLLEWLWLDARGLAKPNPTPDQIIKAPIPLEEGELNGEWYWKVSSPCYRIEAEQTDRFRKRWEPEQDGHINWGKRRAKFSTSEGAEKSYDLPLYLRTCDAITWYCVGSALAIGELLENCTGIGKKRSYGYGAVRYWEIEEVKYDWHLWRDDNLMRPVPVACLKEVPHPSIMLWGWRPPAWNIANRVMCAMPINNVAREGAVV